MVEPDELGGAGTAFKWNEGTSGQSVWLFMSSLDHLWRCVFERGVLM